MVNEIDKFLNRNIDEVEQWTSELLELIENDRYKYADDTLRGILSTIENQGKVTPVQITAITNIKNKPSKIHARIYTRHPFGGSALYRRTNSVGRRNGSRDKR